MSWSVSLIGRPSKVLVALDEQSAKLTGNSKEEFDAVLPGLKAIVGANDETKAVSVNANGSAWDNGGVKMSSCGVDIKPLGAIL